MTRPSFSGLVIAALMLAAGSAAGQNQPANNAGQPGQPPTMVERTPDNKVIRLDGVLDAHAILKSPAIDAATMQNMVPWVTEWTADLNQTAIDNLDFLEKIDDGFIDTFVNTDQARAKYFQHMVQQLTAHGQLAARLQQRGVLTLQQAQSIQLLTNGYIQSVYGELVANMRDPKLQAEAQNEISRFFHHINSRDARAMYHRQVVDSAALLDQIIPSLGLPAETLAKLQPAIAAVRSAKTETEKLDTGRALLKELTFDQRRAFLTKAVALGAAPDPFHPVPTPPPVKASTPTAAAPNAAKPAGN